MLWLKQGSAPTEANSVTQEGATSIRTPHLLALCFHTRPASDRPKTPALLWTALPVAERASSWLLFLLSLVTKDRLVTRLLGLSTVHNKSLPVPAHVPAPGLAPQSA